MTVTETALPERVSALEARVADHTRQVDRIENKLDWLIRAIIGAGALVLFDLAKYAAAHWKP